MQLEPALLTPTAVLIGALVGATASLSAAIYTQRRQDRARKIAREVDKREEVYATFIACASALLIKSFVRNGIALDVEEQQLVGLVNRMRLFATSEVIEAADDVLRAIINVALQPGVDPEQLVRQALSGSPEPAPLYAFSVICRADLDAVHRR